MEISNRKSATDNLKNYDYLAGKYDIIEVTEWKNKEGYDITLETKSGTENISLTIGQLDAIDYLTKTLQFNT